MLAYWSTVTTTGSWWERADEIQAESTFVLLPSQHLAVKKCGTTGQSSAPLRARRLEQQETKESNKCVRHSLPVSGSATSNVSPQVVFVQPKNLLWMKNKWQLHGGFAVRWSIWAVFTAFLYLQESISERCFDTSSLHVQEGVGPRIRMEIKILFAMKNWTPLFLYCLFLNQTFSAKLQSCRFDWFKGKLAPSTFSFKLESSGEERFLFNVSVKMTVLKCKSSHTTSSKLS